MKLCIVSACLVFFFAVGCSEVFEQENERPDTLVSSYDEEEMDHAIARAKASVDEFLIVLEKGEADSFSVKAPISDENGTEHFWIVDITYRDGVFHGLVGNDPGVVQNVEYGQIWQVKKDDISDWMYRREGMIHGGFTIDPLLDSYPEEEAEAIRAQLVR